MEKNKTNWKRLIGNTRRRKILYLLRSMGIATQAQIQDEFRKRQEFLSWSSVHQHIEKLEAAGLIVKEEHLPETEGRMRTNKTTKEKKWVKYTESKYKTFELTSDAKIWLNQLESKSTSE